MIDNVESALLRNLLAKHWADLKTKDIKRDDRFYFELDEKLMKLANRRRPFWNQTSISIVILILLFWFFRVVLGI